MSEAWLSFLQRNETRTEETQTEVQPCAVCGAPRIVGEADDPKCINGCDDEEDDDGAA